MLHRPDKHRKLTWQSWPELIQVRVTKAVSGAGVFEKGGGLVAVKARTYGQDAKGALRTTRALTFSPQGQHQQTNLVSRKSGYETTRVFRRGKWHHTNVRHIKSGSAVHYAPRTGSRPRKGIYGMRRR